MLGEGDDIAEMLGSCRSRVNRLCLSPCCGWPCRLPAGKVARSRSQLVIARARQWALES